EPAHLAGPAALGAVDGAPGAGELPRVAERVRPLLEEVAVQREDRLHAAEAVGRMGRASEGQARPLDAGAALGRVPRDPRRVREALQQAVADPVARRARLLGDDER